MTHGNYRFPRRNANIKVMIFRHYYLRQPKGPNVMDVLQEYNNLCFYSDGRDHFENV
jgi:hypothetical protein